MKKEKIEYTPLEQVEQIALAQWLDYNWYRYNAIRNESDSHSFFAWRKRKRSGVKKWFPDFIIYLKRQSTLYIELKRKKKSLTKISKEQKERIEFLNTIPNSEARVAYGAENAIKLIQEYETK